MGAKSKVVDLDEVLDKFRLFGRYHSEILLLCALAYMSNALYCSNYVFAAEESKYWCIDDDFQNHTCSTINLTQCTKWVFENPDSFVAEFQIICQEWKRTLVGTMHSLGYMFGLLLVGPLSDRIGRKKMVVITGVLGGVIGIAKSFSPYYWLYIVLEFLEAAIGDICSPVYVLNIEIVSTKKRVPFYTFCCFGYIVGGIVLPLSAWTFPYWRTYLRVIYTPALLFFFYLFLLDESPRWLLTKGKKDQAIDILKKAANKNKIKMEDNDLDNLFVEEEKNMGFGSLLKLTFGSKTMLKRFLVCVVWWTTSTFVNYGMVINSVSLEGNKYLNFGLTTIIEIPGLFIIMYVLMKFKRKNPLIVSFVFGAVLCLSQPFLPANLPWLSILVYMLGKLMSSFYFNITYMYTSELFPTYTRNSMHALCSSVGRIGSIIAPQTPLLMAYWDGLPSVVFGTTALFAGMVTLLVPDTANDALPDTFKQAETIGSKAKIIENEEVIERTAC